MILLEAKAVIVQSTISMHRCSEIESEGISESKYCIIALLQQNNCEIKSL